MKSVEQIEAEYQYAGSLAAEYMLERGWEIQQIGYASRLLIQHGPVKGLCALRKRLFDC